MRRLGWRTRHWRADRPVRDAGAAAVEFALVLPVLILILFGIVDYGLYFNAALQSRWGVHDAARMFAVQPVRGTTTVCGQTVIDSPPDIKRLICQVINNTDSATATRYIDVELPNGWVVGGALVVCERLDVSGLTGFVPFPDSGQIRDKAVLTIEQADPDAAMTPPQVWADPLPAGDDWGWCHE
jgi:hypothetical protein